MTRILYQEYYVWEGFFLYIFPLLSKIPVAKRMIKSFQSNTTRGTRRYFGSMSFIFVFGIEISLSCKITLLFSSEIMDRDSDSTFLTLIPTIFRILLKILPKNASDSINSIIVHVDFIKGIFSSTYGSRTGLKSVTVKIQWVEFCIKSIPSYKVSFHVFFPN